MRRFQFDYRLTIGFDAPVSRHTFLFRFFPGSDATQQLWGVEARCTPEAALPPVRDAFGNACACGHVAGVHDHLSLRVSGEALLRGGALPAPLRDIYALPTALTQPDAAIREWIPALPGDPVRAALVASERIHSRVAYRPGVTGDGTTAAQALALGAGVCQDMAHLLLAALRSRGLAARYVAGLIPGEGETHAWVEVYDGAGYVGVDPTHVRLCDDGYLRVNAGRDSRDCAINRGVFLGAARQTLAVSARMTEI